MRLFLAGDFAHIPKLLYLQRLHSANTQRDPEINPFIQSQTAAYYREHCEALHAAWSRRHGLRVLGLRTPTSPDLGNPRGRAGDHARPRRTRRSIAADDSVGLIRCVELLQRIPDRAALLNECYRVAVHGAMLRTSTPSTDGRGAFQDPTHVAFYNENSFWYLTQRELRSSIPALTARLQVGFLGTVFPNDFFRDSNIPFVEANLLVVKDGAEAGWTVAGVRALSGPRAASWTREAARARNGRPGGLLLTH